MYIFVKIYSRMKKIIYLLLNILLPAMLCFSQEQDTSKLNLFKRTNNFFKERESDKKDLNYHGNWAGLEVGFNNYINGAGKIEEGFLEILPWKSRSVSINFSEYNIGLYKNRIGITTGTALEINNYNFKKNITLLADTSPLNYYTDTIHNFIKNKFSVVYLSLPLLFEFQFPVGKKNKRIFFSVGAIGGLAIDAYTHQIFKEKDKEYKNRVREQFLILPYHYGVTFRLGYSFIRLFANYELTPLFGENDGPELYPFSAGVALIAF